MTSQLIDLSHRIEPGMFTHPGLPGPTSTPFRSREESRQTSGTDFQIDQVTMVGNTGTYLDSPFHRFADGGDLASLPLTRCRGPPALRRRRETRRTRGRTRGAGRRPRRRGGRRGARRSRGPAAHRRRSRVGRRGVRRGRAVPHWRRRRHGSPSNGRRLSASTRSTSTTSPTRPDLRTPRSSEPACSSSNTSPGSPPSPLSAPACTPHRRRGAASARGPSARTPSSRRARRPQTLELVVSGRRARQRARDRGR